MPERPSQIEHSHEVQEILGHVPHWLIRWGVGLLFCLLLTIFWGSYFMKYPVVIPAPFIITSLNSPAPLIVKKTGRVSHWLIEDGQLIKSGQIVAILESEAQYQDILVLSNAINKQNLGNYIFPISEDQLEIGSLHRPFIEFIRAMTHMQLLDETNSMTQTKNLIQTEMNQKEQFVNQMLLHRSIKQKEFEMALQRFKKDSSYYHQGGYGISLADYELISRKLLQEKAVFIAYQASFYEHETALIKLKQKLNQLVISHAKELSSLTEALSQARLKLVENINSWESEHIIRAPSSGKLTLTKYWSKNQMLSNGEVFATIVPEGKVEIIGRALVNSQGIGKVKLGQMVNIKLSGFPALEYGTLKGKVKSISLVPQEQAYVIGIELSNGMTSSYQERLKFIQEMDGTAEIIIESRRLLYKLLSI